MRRSNKTKRLLPLMLVTAIAGTACGDDDDGVQPGALEVTLQPTSLTMAPGDSADVDVTITRSGAFTGDVAVEASELPTGVTAEEVDIPGTDTEGVLTLVADSSAEATVDTVTVTASAPGADEATAELVLTISDGNGAAGAYQLELQTDTLEIEAGETDSVMVAIDRSGDFTGPVAFSSDGEPDGMTISFAQDTVSGDTARVTVETETSVTADSTYMVAIIGSAEGQQDQTDTLAVTVTAAAAGAGSASMSATWLTPSTGAATGSAAEASSGARVARAAFGPERARPVSPAGTHARSAGLIRPF